MACRWAGRRRWSTAGCAHDGTGSARTAFGLQLVANVAWSFAFFGFRSVGAGLVAIAALWLVVLGWLRAAWRIDRAAGLLQAPYLVWVTFAGLLNARIWLLNRR